MITRGEFEAHKNDPNAHVGLDTDSISPLTGDLDFGNNSALNVNKLAIGKASTDVKLDIYENTDGDVGVRIENPNTGSNARAMLVLRVDADGDASTEELFHLRAKYNENKTQLVGRLGTDIEFIVDSERDFIFTGGDVGIGTDTPGAKLDIVTTSLPLRVNRTSAGGADWAIQEWHGSPGEVMRITYGGELGIRTSSPGYTLDVSGDIHCTGKLTSDGGNDPAYVLYDYQTRTSLIELVKKEVPPSKLGGAVLFFNGEKQSLELFLPLKGEFRSLNGELLEKTDPITKTFEVEKRYYFDEEDGEVKSYEVKKNPRRYKLKEGVSFDNETGKFKKIMRRKVKKIIDGKEEMVEIEEEKEVTKEEAIEEVQEAV